MRLVTVAATQMACSDNHSENLDRAEQLIRDAAQQGGQIILIQELFATPYFCKDQDVKYFDWAHRVEQHPFLDRFSQLAKELKVVLPISFFERANNAYFNSVMMIDADGQQLGVYRKTHIPDGAGYQEKFYFCQGDTGFKVWQTAYGKIGVGICWDQWFPESARAMAIQGAELLFYPTAIGSEPENNIDSAGHWQRTMQGHAAANIMPLICSNRIGKEVGESCELTFYGSSFICNETGEVVTQANRNDETVLMAEFDLDAIQTLRNEWSVFRDRCPDKYLPLLDYH
ncbi:N-carbamoylputrescine amidase [Candidatus Albibeggiatoa sp. nov. NOAA]|uniref:N-carbamoylputrescine amidase n=1 Tax=Candidatus Albibeggiatoa sp. nov. NOAA TaxID=3162724 RepID=UPI0032F73441|nr:N-carbamoylputrescine amidase [Thiotrichaceae bacterium]